MPLAPRLCERGARGSSQIVMTRMKRLELEPMPLLLIVCEKTIGIRDEIFQPRATSCPKVS